MYNHNIAQQSSNRVHISWDKTVQGLYSLSGRMYYRKISSAYVDLFSIGPSERKFSVIWNNRGNLVTKCHPQNGSHLVQASMYDIGMPDVME